MMAGVVVFTTVINNTVSTINTVEPVSSATHKHPIILTRARLALLDTTTTHLTTRCGCGSKRANFNSLNVFYRNWGTPPSSLHLPPVLLARPWLLFSLNFPYGSLLRPQTPPSWVVKAALLICCAQHHYQKTPSRMSSGSLTLPQLW